MRRRSNFNQSIAFEQSRVVVQSGLARTLFDGVLSSDSMTWHFIDFHSVNAYSLYFTESWQFGSLSLLDVLHIPCCIQYSLVYYFNNLYISKHSSWSGSVSVYLVPQTWFRATITSWYSMSSIFNGFFLSTDSWVSYYNRTIDSTYYCPQVLSVFAHSQTCLEVTFGFIPTFCLSVFVYNEPLLSLRSQVNVPYRIAYALKMDVY